MTSLQLKGVILIGIVSVLAFWLNRSAPADPKDHQELVILCPYGPILEQVKRVAREFETSNPGWSVRVIPAPGRDYYTKTLSLLAARTPIDLLWLGMGFAMFADRGALLEIDEFAGRDAGFSLEEFTDEALAMYRLKGKLYGLPYALDAQAYAVNEALLKEHGLAIPDENWTLEDFLRIGRTTTQFRTGETRIYGFGMTEVSPTLFGMQLISSDGQSFGLDGRKGTEWLKLNLQLAKEGALLRSAGTGQLDRLNEFLSGRVGIMTVYTWDLQELHLRMGGRYRLLPPPRNDADDQRTWASSQGFSIPRRSHHPERAWELLKLLTSASLQESLPKSFLPTRKKVLHDYQEALLPQDHALITLLPMLAPDPRIKNWGKVESEWRYWQDQAFEGQRTPEEAISTASRRINAILAKEAHP